MRRVARDQQDIDVTIDCLFRTRHAAKQVDAHWWLSIATDKRGKRLSKTTRELGLSAEQCRERGREYVLIIQQGEMITSTFELRHNAKGVQIGEGSLRTAQRDPCTTRQLPLRQWSPTGGEQPQEVDFGACPKQDAERFV